jgi:cysteine-rich repeat protein
MYSTLLLLLLPLLSHAEPIPPTDTHEVTTLKIHIAPNPLLTNDTNCLEDISCPEGTTRTVSYFKSGDQAVIDGDVIFGTEADLLAAAVNNTEGNAVKRAYSIFPWASSRKWPFGVIRYRYADADTETTRGPKFEAAIKRWTNMLPSLQFIKDPVPSSVVEPGVLVVRSVYEIATYSYVGMAPFPQILLGRPELPESDYWYTHGIGHTLGLMHEHQRPDRDSYLTLDCSKVAPTSSGITPVCVEPCADSGCYFTHLDFATDPNWYAGTYDIKSIMHFNPEIFAINPADPPLKPINPIVFDNNRLLPTVTDANRVCEIYWEVCRGVCGDGILALANGEVCDDGNNIDGDGCSADCGVEPPKFCGDGIVQANEDCEPPNVGNCGADCKWIPPHCGNGILDLSLGEECEPPNTATCTADCKNIVPSTCPAHCNPNVPNNLCHETTSCIPLFGAAGGPGLPFGMSYMCACRAGFRADGIDPTDKTKQVRFSATSYTSYVFVQPGVSCDTECSPDTNPFPCSEVPRHDECF